MRRKLNISWFFGMLLLIFCFSLYGQNSEEKTKADAQEYTIDNCVTHFDIKNVDSTKVGWQFWFVDKHFANGFTLKMSNVLPGSATHPPHVHPEDEIFYIVEGTAEFILGGEKKTVGPNTSLYCPSNVSHGIRNVGNGVLKYLVIKTYPDVE